MALKPESVILQHNWRIRNVGIRMGYQHLDSIEILYPLCLIQFEEWAFSNLYSLMLYRQPGKALSGNLPFSASINYPKAAFFPPSPIHTFQQSPANGAIPLLVALPTMKCGWTA